MLHWWRRSDHESEIIRVCNDHLFLNIEKSATASGRHAQDRAEHAGGFGIDHDIFRPVRCAGNLG